MTKALTRAEMEALGPWFDEHIEETEADWEEAKRNGKIRTVGSLGCSSLAEASKISAPKKRASKRSGTVSVRHSAPIAAASAR